MNFQWNVLPDVLPRMGIPAAASFWSTAALRDDTALRAGIHQHPDRQTAFEALDQGVRDDIVFHHVERHVNPGTLVGDERQQGSAAVLERGVTQALGGTGGWRGGGHQQQRARQRNRIGGS